MLKSILISALFFFAVTTQAQTILSKPISWFSGTYEQIDFYDENDNSIVSLAPKFYRQKESKMWIKPIEIGDKTYFIKRKKRFGLQSVYSNSGENVANMESKMLSILNSYLF